MLEDTPNPRGIDEDNALIALKLRKSDDHRSNSFSVFWIFRFTDKLRDFTKSNGPGRAIEIVNTDLLLISAGKFRDDRGDRDNTDGQDVNSCQAVDKGTLAGLKSPEHSNFNQLFARQQLLARLYLGSERRKVKCRRDAFDVVKNLLRLWTGVGEHRLSRLISG